MVPGYPGGPIQNRISQEAINSGKKEEFSSEKNIIEQLKDKIDSPSKQ